MSRQLDLISDHSKEELTEVPDQLLDMSNLKMLFLEGNYLTELPGDFFHKLPKLMWLDLRNNLLESLPKSIARHKHLENLLLSNNNIRELPKELGVVPNLKALQVSENPLVYPVRRIITEGTKAIKNYLKREYERLISLAKDGPNEDEDAFAEDEQVISTVDIESASEIMPKQTSECTAKESTSEIRVEIKKELTEQLDRKLSDLHRLQPTIQIRNVMPPPPVPKKKPLPLPLKTNKLQEEPLKFVHKVSRDGSKISLKSCFNKIGIRNDMNKMENKNLREGWLNQLRILLTDQERIIQQERNLRALSEWRTTEKKKAEAPRTFYDMSGPAAETAPVVPYATYAEYSKMPTRQELAAQVNDFLKEKGVSKAGLSKGHDVNYEKLINDLVEQIKEMENAYSATRSPRSEMEQAGNQIKAVSRGRCCG